MCIIEDNLWWYKICWTVLNRKAGNKSQYQYFGFQHLSAHLWILLKWCITLYLFPYNSAGVVMKFMSTSVPSCSCKWHEKEMWMCLMCFTLEYSELQCSDWASWISGRTYTIKNRKAQQMPRSRVSFPVPAAVACWTRHCWQGCVSSLHLSFQGRICVRGSARSDFSILILSFWG